MMIIMIGLTWDERKKLYWHSQHTYAWGVVSYVSKLCIAQTEAHIEIYEDGRLIWESLRMHHEFFCFVLQSFFACTVHFAKSLLDCILPSRCNCVARITLPHKTYSNIRSTYPYTRGASWAMYDVCVHFILSKITQVPQNQNKNWIKIENSRQNTLARRAEWKVLPKLDLAVRRTLIQ